MKDERKSRESIVRDIRRKARILCILKTNSVQAFTL